MSANENNLHSPVSNNGGRKRKWDQLTPSEVTLLIQTFDAKHLLRHLHKKYVYKAITMAFQMGIQCMREKIKRGEDITHNQLARWLDIGENTYYCWLRAYHDWESFKGWYHPSGRPISKHNRNIVQKIIDSSSEALDTATIAMEVNNVRKRDGKPSISEDQVRKVQRALEYTPKRASKIQRIFDESLHKSRLQSAAEILDYLADEGNFVVFMDEARIRLDVNGRKLVSSKAGVPALIKVMPNKGSYTVMLTCSQDKTLFSTVFAGNSKGTNVRDYVDNMLSAIKKCKLNVAYEDIDGKRRKIAKKIIVVMDNALVQNERFLQKVITKHGAKLSYQPEYCPWVNFCEYAFSRLKGYISEARRGVGKNPNHSDIMAQEFDTHSVGIQNRTENLLQPQNSSSSSSSRRSSHATLNRNILLNEDQQMLNDMYYSSGLPNGQANDEAITEEHQENIESEEEDSPEESESGDEEYDNNESDFSSWHTWLNVTCRKWMSYDNMANKTTHSFESAKAVLENITKMSFPDAIRQYRKMRNKQNQN